MNFASSNVYHPATLDLLRNQSRAKFAKLTSSFRNPRRRLLSIVATLLGLVWISQALFTVFFRESANPEKLLTWIPLGLFTYSVWHLLKIVGRKPVEPFEWTGAEKEFLLAAPITRTQTITYRLVVIAKSAVLKAACFSVMMIPDLNIWLAGFAGMLLGLMFIDLFRVCCELFFYALSKQQQIVARVIVLGSVAACVGYALLTTLSSPHALADVSSPGSLIFFKNFVSELIGLMSTTVGSVFLLPFQPFAKSILADQFTLPTLGYAGASISMVALAALAVYQLDCWCLSRVRAKEKTSFKRGMTKLTKVVESVKAIRNVRVPVRLAGAGSIAWRQMLGAYHYRMSLVISLGVPTILCCIPLLAKHQPFPLLLNIVAASVFYSFLLLPAALMLDFRRDIDRMTVLKSLPISPLAMTIGQLSVPVLLCCVFQWVVLAIATCTGSVIGWQALFAAVLLIPINGLIIAIENFVFLLSPYRRNQEGLDVFLRTILTFTAKGLLFAFALAITFAWVLASKAIVNFCGGTGVAKGIVFGGGLWLFTCLVTAVLIFAIANRFDRFDPSQDGIED